MAYTKEQREANAKKKTETLNTNKTSNTVDEIKAELEAKIRAELESEYKSKLTKETVIISKEPEKKIKAKVKIPLDTLVPCRSGVQGTLIYISKKINGYQIEWDSYGSVEYVELGELLSMRNTSRSFYVNNWIFFEDTDDYSALEIYEFLEVSKYYENAILGEELDEIFNKSPEDIKKIVSKLSKGVKETVAAKAKSLIDSGELDSGNRIKALEEALNVEFKPV
jgi:hypothetical protein